MAKLSIHYLYELSKDQLESIKDEFRETFIPAYLTHEAPHLVVNAQFVTDEDGTVYDIRVYDPFGLVHPSKDEDGLMDGQAANIGPDGWSDWLLAYTDPDGNDIDTIFENQE